MNNKTLFNRIFIGFKHSWNLPSLPANVLYFHNHLFTRIFRILGGISIGNIISGTGKTYVLNSDLWPLYYLILFLGTLHIFYIIFIKIIKIYYLIYSWVKGELDVRNSPLDKVSTIAAKAFQCAKFGCDVGAGTVGLITTGFVIDQVLEAGGKPKVFTNMMGDIVKTVSKDEPLPEESKFDSVKKEIDNLEKHKLHMKEFSKSLDVAEQLAQSEDSGFTKGDASTILEEIKKLREADENKLAEFSSSVTKKIKEISSDKD